MRSAQTIGTINPTQKRPVQTYAVTLETTVRSTASHRVIFQPDAIPIIPIGRWIPKNAASTTERGWNRRPRWISIRRAA